MPCLQAYLLQQYGKSGDESENITIPNGPQRYWRHAEHIYTSWTGGCRGRTETDGRIGKCEEGAG